MEIRYRIELMEEAGFYYCPDYDYDKLDLNNITYQFAQDITPIVDKEELSMTITVEMTPMDSNIVLAKECVYSVFKIDPFNKVIQVKGDSFKTTEPLLIDTFVNIVIGALRGMLVKNLKGTPLAKTILPLIPMDVIHKQSTLLAEKEEPSE